MPKYVGERLLLMILVFISIAIFLSNSNCPESVFRCSWNSSQYILLGISIISLILLAILED